MVNINYVKRALAALLALAALFLVNMTAFAEGVVPIKQLGTYGQQARIADYDNCLTEAQENELLEIMQKAAKSAKCNIGIVIANELNGKSHVTYANDFLDDNFGKTSNSIVILFFNSYNRPEYINAKDHISTTGAMINKTQSNITRIFDRIYAQMGNPRGNQYAYNTTTNTYGGYDYFAACKEFVKNVKRYGSSGFVKIGATMADYVADSPMMFLGGLFIAFVIMFITVKAKVNGYKRKATLSAATYLDKRATRVTRQVDQFVREYTTSHTNSSSSGGGHHGGGGGGSHGGGSGHHR